LAVEKYPWNIRIITHSKRTPEVCMVAVQYLSSLIRYVPWENRTPELCLIAVQKDIGALRYIHEYVHE